MSIVHYKHRENPIEVDTFIKKEREKNGGFITPYIANNVLEMTNHFACIKVVIKEINKLDKNKKMEFEDFVYNAIAGREHSNEAYAGLKKLAIECGWEEGFNSADKLPKCYDVYGKKFFGITNGKKYLKGNLSHYDMIKCRERVDEIEILGVSIFSDTSKGALLPLVCDFSLVDKLKILGAKETFQERYKELKFTEGGNIILQLYDKAPPKIEFNKAWVLIEYTDLSIVDELIFNDCERVIFRNCVLPEKLDVSSVKELKFINISQEIAQLDLSGCEKIEFNNCPKLPDGFDFYNCDDITLIEMKLDNFTDFKFKDGANIMFDECGKVPEQFDLSAFSKVYFLNMFCGQLSSSSINFREGANVSFEAVETPLIVDFSKCGELYIENMRASDMIYTKVFKFRNREQYKQVADELNGRIHSFSKIVFVDENRAYNYKMQDLGFER